MITVEPADESPREAPRNARMSFPTGREVTLTLIYAGVHRGFHVFDVRRSNGLLVPRHWIDAMGGKLEVEYVPPNTRIRMETIRP